MEEKLCWQAPEDAELEKCPKPQRHNGSKQVLAKLAGW